MSIYDLLRNIWSWHSSAWETLFSWFHRAFSYSFSKILSSFFILFTLGRAVANAVAVRLNTALTEVLQGMNDSSIPGSGLGGQVSALVSAVSSHPAGSYILGCLNMGVAASVVPIFFGIMAVCVAVKIVTFVIRNFIPTFG